MQFRSLFSASLARGGVCSHLGVHVPNMIHGQESQNVSQLQSETVTQPLEEEQDDLSNLVPNDDLAQTRIIDFLDKNSRRELVRVRSESDTDSDSFLAKVRGVRRIDKDSLVEIKVCCDGLSLRFGSETLRKDQNVVLSAVSENGMALRCAGVSLRKDQNVVLRAVGENGMALQFVDVSLKQDRAIVMVAVLQNGNALVFADDSLKADEQIVVAANDSLTKAGEQLLREVHRRLFDYE